MARDFQHPATVWAYNGIRLTSIVSRHRACHDEIANHEENDLADNTLVIFTSDNGGMFNHGGQAAF